MKNIKEKFGPSEVWLYKNSVKKTNKITEFWLGAFSVEFFLNSRNRGAREHCSRDFGAKKQIFEVKVYAFFISRKISALILCLLKIVLKLKFLIKF